MIVGATFAGLSISISAGVKKKIHQASKSSTWLRAVNREWPAGLFQSRMVTVTQMITLQSR